MARRWLVLLAALQQALVPLVVNPFRDGHSRVQAGEPSQIEPAGYAFTLWGLIYLAALAYAAWQLRAAPRDTPTADRIAPFAVALYAGSSAWLWAADRGPLWTTMPILAGMAVCAVVCLVRARAGADTAAHPWVAVAPFALYAGWTACAVFVNVAEVAPELGFGRFGLGVAAYGALSIAAAGAVAVGVLALARGAWLFAATVVWALAGILVAGVQRGAGLPVLVAAGAAAAVVVLAAALLHRRAPA